MPPLPESGRGCTAAAPATNRAVHALPEDVGRRWGRTGWRIQRAQTIWHEIILLIQSLPFEDMHRDKKKSTKKATNRQRKKHQRGSFIFRVDRRPTDGRDTTRPNEPYTPWVCGNEVVYGCVFCPSNADIFNTLLRACPLPTGNGIRHGSNKTPSTISGR